MLGPSRNGVMIYSTRCKGIHNICFCVVHILPCSSFCLTYSSIRNVQFYYEMCSSKSICAALKTIMCSCKIRIFRIIFVQKINEWNGIHSDLRKYTNNVSRQPGKGKESLIAIPPITRLFLQFLIVQGIWSFPTLSLP